MKFRKLVAGILSAVMIGTSLCAVPAAADGVSLDKIEDDWKQIKNGETVNGYKPVMSAETYYINVTKTGKVEASIKTNTGVMFGILRSTVGGWNFEADTITIDNKVFNTSDVEVIGKDEIIGYDECGVETDEIRVFYSLYPYDYMIESKDGKEHNVKFTYNTIEKGYYILDCSNRGDYNSQFTLSFPSDSGSSSSTKLAATKLSANAKKNVLTLKWDKVSGAEKYQVVYSTDGGKKFKVLKELTGTSVSVKLKKGTKYKFAVRSYKTENGKKVYSKYSNIKNVKY